MAASNALSEKVPIFVVRKTTKRRHLKYIPILPCRYCVQKAVWMDGISATINFLMIVDNCSANHDIRRLTAIYLQFWPPNAISNTQLMDLGSISDIFFVYFLLDDSFKDFTSS